MSLIYPSFFLGPLEHMLYTHLSSFLFQRDRCWFGGVVCVVGFLYKRLGL